MLSTSFDRAFTAALESIQALKTRPSERLLIAIAGSPASGKTTLAKQLSDALPNASYVGMDGFHLDNKILATMGLMSRKGAPETFDVDGLTQMLHRLKQRRDVYVPDFDRQIDRSINCAHCVPETNDVVIIEGNYLLLDKGVWRNLHRLWDWSIFLSPNLQIVEQRLFDRWISYGYSREQAHMKVHGNDLRNAEVILMHQHPADLTLLSSDSDSV